MFGGRFLEDPTNAGRHNEEDPLTLSQIRARVALTMSRSSHLTMVTSLGASRGLLAEDCVSLEDKYLSLDPGETRRLCDLQGPGRIVRFWFAMPQIGQRHMLRDVVCRIFWDDETEPSVECPIGDLFGAAFGKACPIVSERLVIAGGGYLCRFEMPFGSRAVVELHNQASRRLRYFFFQISYYRESCQTEDLATFHAQWKRENPTHSSEAYRILNAHGKGRYVGVKLDMQNRAWWLKPPITRIAIPRGFGLGHLEGWETVRVDDDASRSMVGTGGEDYFNGGFYFAGGRFNTPTHGVIVKSYLTGRVSAYRLHIDDPIPFESSIDITIDHGFRNELEGDYSSVTYWYQKEPHMTFATLPSARDRRPSLPWINVLQHLILATVVCVLALGLGAVVWSLAKF